MPSQGQKIYTITKEVYQNNPNIVNANLSAHSAATTQAVQNALDIGHEVTIHEAPITQSGWTGAGYTTIDPATGAGGYMIDGGSNGGTLVFQGGAALLSIMTMMSGLNILRILGIASYVGAGINPFLNLFVAAITFLAAAVSDNPYETTAASQPLKIISTLTNLGLLAALLPGGAGILFAIVFTVLLIYVALLVQELILVLTAELKSSDKFINMRYA